MVDVFIRRWATRLHRSFDRVQHCDVVVELPHRHHEHGRVFHVRVAVTVLGRELVVSQDPGADGAHEDVYVAVRDAFRAMRRQVEAHMRHVASGHHLSAVDRGLAR
jgi:ribosome-associated translation inhibitor RaiA